MVRLKLSKTKSSRLRLASDSGFVRQHAKRDIVVVRIGTAVTNAHGSEGTKYVSAISLGPNSHDEFVVWDADHICLNSNDVFEGAEALILGYPVELLEEFSEVDFSRPLVRGGRISQKHPITGKFIIDSGVYGGNSGGPLLVTVRTNLSAISYRMAGIMVKFVPAQTRVFPNAGFTNSVLVFSGYSVAEPIDGALELMRQ
jgi:hypothetical protein